MYVEAPLTDDRLRQDTIEWMHPSETQQTLRVAEDLRFFYAHLWKNGRLQLLREPLLTYRHRAGVSQSSNTPRKILMGLRTLAFSRFVLRKKPEVAESPSPLLQAPSWDGPFCVWGAGRDGKDFIKALDPDLRQRIYCMVDVDEKKLQSQFYVNRDHGTKIPIVHFSLLAADATVQSRLVDAWVQGRDEDLPGYGRIDKGEPNKQVTEPPPTKKARLRRTHYFGSGVVDEEVLRSIPVGTSMQDPTEDRPIAHSLYTSSGLRCHVSHKWSLGTKRRSDRSERRRRPMALLLIPYEPAVAALANTTNASSDI